MCRELNSLTAQASVLACAAESVRERLPGSPPANEIGPFGVEGGQALAEWIMYDKNGTEFLSGKSFARFGPDGRLTQLTGFWEL
jgi:hypothetical protein